MIASGATRTIAAVALGQRASYVLLVTFCAIALAVGIPAWAPAASCAAVLAAAGEVFSAARFAELSNLRYFAAPLYGRELARAHAVVASRRFVFVALALLPVAMLVGPFAPNLIAVDAWYRVSVMTLGQVVTSLVSMSGSLRRGRERWLYFGLAVAAGLTIDGIGSPATPASLLCAIVVAFALGFAALRAFGETLARYDPID